MSENPANPGQHHEPFDKTCLSYWFPRIEKAGLPVPLTHWTGIGREGWRNLMNSLDKPPRRNSDLEHGHNALIWLADWIAEKGSLVCLPFFLRTGQTSGKHQWTDTCFVNTLDQKEIAKHIMAIVEYSEMADMIGLACDVWVVRQFIKTAPICLAYRGMPVNREWRFFVEGGRITHTQFYWPKRSVKQGSPQALPGKALDWQADLARIGTLDSVTRTRLERLSLDAAQACEEDYSIDWLQDADGNWLLTDMAEAARSFRYDPDAPEPEEDEYDGLTLIPAKKSTGDESCS